MIYLMENVMGQSSKGRIADSEVDGAVFTAALQVKRKSKSKELKRR
jgi:hypothetical protein